MPAMLLIPLPAPEPANVWLEVFGRFHLVLLHLPIGLLPAMFVLEFGAALLKKPVPRGAILTLAVLTVLVTAMAFASGWVLAEEPRTAAKNLLIAKHRNFAIAFAAVCLLLPFAAARSRRGPFRVVLAAALGLSIATGHFGGEAVHKRDFLLQPLRKRQRAARAEPEPSTTAPTATLPTPNYGRDVAPLLEKYCTECHNPDDYEGDLDLTQRDGILGVDRDEADRVVLPGNPKDSYLLELCELPLDDEDHMPPEEEEQPGKEQVDVLRRWIAAGCPFE